jgi:hypothetical protein
LRIEVSRTDHSCHATDGDQTRWGSGDNSEGEAGDDNGIADERGALEQGYGFAI